MESLNHCLVDWTNWFNEWSFKHYIWSDPLNRVYTMVQEKSILPYQMLSLELLILRITLISEWNPLYVTEWLLDKCQLPIGVGGYHIRLSPGRPGFESRMGSYFLPLNFTYNYILLNRCTHNTLRDWLSGPAASPLFLLLLLLRLLWLRLAG